MITLVPDAPVGYEVLAQVHSYLGDAEGVRRNAAMAEARYNGGIPNPTLAVAYARIGDDSKARQTVDLIRAKKHGKLNAYSDLFLGMAVRDYDAALDSLEQAIDGGFLWAAARDLHYLSGHPMFDPVRGHPKFADLVRRARLPLD